MRWLAGRLMESNRLFLYWFYYPQITRVLRQEIINQSVLKRNKQKHEQNSNSSLKTQTEETYAKTRTYYALIWLAWNSPVASVSKSVKLEVDNANCSYPWRWKIMKCDEPGGGRTCMWMKFEAMLGIDSDSGLENRHYSWNPVTRIATGNRNYFELAEFRVIGVKITVDIRGKSKEN